MVNKLQKIALTFLVVFLVLQPFGILTAQAQSAADKYSTPTQPMKGGDDFACGTTTFTHCIAAMVYYIGPGLASWAASIGSYYFSLVVQLSLNSTAYALTFISDGWTVVRDIANMTFIFLLIYIALTIMFQAETTRTMQMLAAVIAVALLVNFSFYLTRVVVDAGNILAVQFYNALPNNLLAGNSNNVKDLSFSIMSAVNLQDLYGSAMLDNAIKATGNNSAFGGLITVTVIYLSVAAMFWMLFFSFVTAGIKFMLRIVGLWFVIISSPLAFIAWTIPAGKTYFNKWFGMLWQYSIYPAVYLFMFLILSNFAKTILLGNSGGGSLVNSLFSSGVKQGGDAGILNIAATIANVGIRMGFVIAMLHIGLKVADWVVTEGNGIAESVTGKVRGVLGGGVGLAGRVPGAVFSRTVGATAQKSIDSLKKNPPNTRVGQYLNYSLRNKVLKPLTEKSLGGAASYSSVQAAKKIRDKDWSENLAARQFKKDAQRLGELNKQWDPLEKRIKEIESDEKEAKAAGTTVSPSHMAEKARLQKEQGAIGTERSILAKRAESASNAHMSTLAAADIQGIIKQVSDGHLKAIKESEKHSEVVMKEITTKWHEENKKAPKAESEKQLVELEKIRETLEKKGLKTDEAIHNLEAFHKYTTKKVGETITLKEAESAKKEVAAAKEKYEETRDDFDAAKPVRTAAGQKAKELKKAEDKLDKLIEKIKDVPEQVGGEQAPAAFKKAA